MSGIRKQAHPERDAPSAPGTSSGSWSFATPPAWRAKDEIRAPATLVEAIFHATADAGSIPAVSIDIGKSCSGERLLLLRVRLLPTPWLPLLHRKRRAAAWARGVERGVAWATCPRLRDGGRNRAVRP